MYHCQRSTRFCGQQRSIAATFNIPSKAARRPSRQRFGHRVEALKSTRCLAPCAHIISLHQHTDHNTHRALRNIPVCKEPRCFAGEPVSARPGRNKSCSSVLENMNTICSCCVAGSTASFTNHSTPHGQCDQTPLALEYTQRPTKSPLAQ